MFGLTFEKLLLIGLIAVLIIGPDRLPLAAAGFARFVRWLKRFADGAKSRMREELGPDYDDIDWRKLDPRQYDPRRIIREALLDDGNAKALPPSAATGSVSRTARKKPTRSSATVTPFDQEAT